MYKFKKIYRPIVLVMAMLMFFTSIGISMDMHFCGKNLKSFSLYGKAKNCKELMVQKESAMKGCAHHDKKMTHNGSCADDNNCCSNKHLDLELDQDQKIQANDVLLSKQQKQFVVAYIAIFLSNEVDPRQESLSITIYRPPLIPRDIPVLLQTFLL